MFCPSCGARLAKALSYCNQCGANLSPLKADGKRETTTDTVVWVIVGTTITLLGMALGALVLMKDGAIHQGLGIAFVILSFVALVLVESVLLWRLLRLNPVAQWNRAVPRSKDLITDELEADAPRSLNDPSESATNAAEQTTRVFEPAYRNDSSD